MDFEDIENKENLPPYLKSVMLSTVSQNKKIVLTAAEKARVLKEKIFEKREMWLDKNLQIKQKLTIPEEILPGKNNALNLYPSSSFLNHWYQESS